MYLVKPKKINIRKFKSTLLATLIGWKVRRILAVLKQDKETSEAIELTKLREDIKDQEDNLFFNQILEKLPEKFDNFHLRLSEMLNSQKWPEKPITKTIVKKQSKISRNKEASNEEGLKPGKNVRVRKGSSFQK